MTWQFTPNLLVLAAADHGRCWTELKDLMVAHSAYTVKGTGDGTGGAGVFENVGDTAGPYDVLTAGAAGPWASGINNSFSNHNAWMRLAEVGSTREYMIHRATANSAALEDDYIIQFSPTGFDDVGIASATVAPTASAGDAEFIIGTGVSTQQPWGPTYSADAKIHVAVNDVAVNGVFAWYIVGRHATTGVGNGAFIMEAMNEIVVGDPEPWAVYAPRVVGVTANMEYLSLDESLGGYHNGVWLAPGGTTLGMSLHGIVDGAGNRMAPGFTPPQPDGKARTWPIPTGRSPIAGYKGVCANLRWKGTDARDYPDVRDLASADAMVYFDDVLFPWETAATPI